MKRSAIFKWFFIFSVAFIILLVIEIVVYFIFTFAIEITVDTEQYLTFDLIFTSGLMPINAAVLWIMIFIAICAFLVVSLITCWVALKKKLVDKVLAKSLLVLGVVLIIGAFIKMMYIVLLAQTEINAPVSIDFLGALWSSNVIAVILWLYFTAIVCCFLITGLIYGATGIKWYTHIDALKLTTESN